MVLLERSEVCMIPLDVNFEFKVHFSIDFFKMVSVWVRFRPGFPLGGGFPAEQFAPAWWK
jgi:hypothetical protein